MSFESVLEIAGVAVGLLYLWFEYKASIWLWLTGIIMPAIYIYVYRSAGFYADMGINIYYLVAGVWGWLAWLRHGEGGKKLPISRTPKSMWWKIGAIAAVAYVAILEILLNFTDSSVPYGDTFTTALSIVGLLMLSRKYVEQWLVWLAVDAVSAALYLYKGLYPTAGLYALYCVIAVAGYRKWLKMMHNESDCQNIE